MKKNRGITLIALVITIIILLILAGVAISMITGGEGLLTKTKDTKNRYTHASVYEALQLQVQNHQYDLYAKETDKTLIEYLEEKEIVKQSTKNPEEYIVNVEKLSGKKIDIGNGTDEQTDVYKLIARKSVAKLASVSITQLALSNSGIVGWDVWYFGTAEEEPMHLGSLGGLQGSDKETYTPTSSDYFNYITNDNDEIEIVGFNFNKLKNNGNSSYYTYYASDIEKLVIPSQIEGKPITKVAFGNTDGIDAKWCKVIGIKSIVYPNTVVEINNSGKVELSDVESIILSDNLKIIGEDAFKGYTKLSTIRIPQKVETIGNGAFRGCVGLTKVEMLPTALNIIGEYAFADCIRLTTIKIPAVTIEKKAFNGCRSLLTVEILEDVQNIGESAFSEVSGGMTIEENGIISWLTFNIYVHGKNSEEEFTSLGENWSGGENVEYLGTDR